MIWSEEEDEKIFNMYKSHGTAWTLIAKSFKGRTESQVKNRFYSTLRRVATRKMAQSVMPYKRSINIKKEDLLNFVNDAIDYGHDCFSKRGRKRKEILKDPKELNSKMIQNDESDLRVNTTKSLPQSFPTLQTPFSNLLSQVEPFALPPQKDCDNNFQENIKETNEQIIMLPSFESCFSKYNTSHDQISKVQTKNIPVMSSFFFGFLTCLMKTSSM